MVPVHAFFSNLTYQHLILKLLAYESGELRNYRSKTHNQSKIHETILKISDRIRIAIALLISKSRELFNVLERV